MMKIFDQMWLRAGLDLKVLATAHEVGWIEVVRHSTTTASIQKQTSGVSAIFNEKTLAKWLREHNPSEMEYKAAVDTFVRTCAASCVATHNDNIMIDKTGHLFHIDFGKFLGNAQMFLAFKRDRAPFVFTPDMAYVMGGTNSDNFKLFVDLCCKAYNVLRKNADIFINLFAMVRIISARIDYGHQMLSTGIPELRNESDLDYLREEEEANKKFVKLIDESLHAKATQLNFAIHLLANPQ